MKRETIDFEGLISAIETEFPNVEHYLELGSGKVLTIVTSPPRSETSDEDLIARDNLVLSKRVQAEPQAYERIPTIDAEMGLSWMRTWSKSVEDPGIRDRLLGVLRDCTDDCFKAFRRELLNVPEDVREGWFEFRAAKLRDFVAEWIGTDTDAR